MIIEIGYMGSYDQTVIRETRYSGRNCRCTLSLLDVLLQLFLLDDISLLCIFVLYHIRHALFQNSKFFHQYWDL